MGRVTIGDTCAAEGQLSQGGQQRSSFPTALVPPLVAILGAGPPRGIECRYLGFVDFVQRACLRGGGEYGGGNTGGGNQGDGSSCAPVRISRVKPIPRQGRIYRDGYLNMLVRVTNRGNSIARRVDLYLTSSRKKVEVPRRLRFHQILPGWTSNKTFKVEAKRSVRGWVMIGAQAWGKRNRSYLKLIKPWWPA